MKILSKVAQNILKILQNVLLFYSKLINVLKGKIHLLTLSTSDYLNRFRYGFTLFPMMWTVSMQIRLIRIERLSDK